MIAPDKWRPADGLTLEPNALRAAREQGRTLALTAGPGAGKTEVLAQRADFLLRTGLCPYPHRILAISFKVDASRNLRERVRRRCGAELASRFDSHTFHAFAKRLIDRFRPVLTGQDALDPNYVIGTERVSKTAITFADLVPLAVDILKKSDVARNAVRQTYSHVFLDEFQDCTDAQYALIRAAFQGTSIPLTAVGDTKQRIMGWAGALEGIFVRYAKEFDALPLNLYQNFRSKPRLRRMQNRMIKLLEAAAAVDQDELQGDEGSIRRVHFGDSFEEATTIADWIQSWIEKEGIPHSEIAILVSKLPDQYAEHLMAELKSRGIPFRNEQRLQDLSAEPISRLLLDFLMVVFGEREPDAFSRLMGTLGFSYQEDDTGQHARWQSFLDDQRRSRPGPDGLDVTAVKILVTGFLKELGPAFLLSLSAEYEQGPYLKAKIEETLTRIEDLWKESGDLLRALARFSEDRAVRILTIHKSKGLEFDSVILLGVENETFFGKDADERAAFFVGISRAKERLILTSVDHRPTPETPTKRWNEKRTVHEEFMSYADGLE